MRNAKLGFIIRFSVAVLAVYVFFTLINIQMDITRKADEIDHLRQQVFVKTQENARLTDMLETEIDDEYIANIAREKLGYALPGERFFEDISQN